MVQKERCIIMSEDTKRLNVVISSDLHRELKVAVAKQGNTIGQFVAEAIKEKLESQEKNINDR